MAETTNDALEIIDRRYGFDTPEAQARIEAIRQDMDVAEQIYRLRKAAGLTQAQLARVVRTSPSVISRLEDADYEGHSLSMLRRIAAALRARVEVRLVAEAPGVTTREGRARAPWRRQVKRRTKVLQVGDGAAT
jgi:transcriptional regulator with XRE-family HTH domain